MFIKKKENASLRHENKEIKEQIESNKSQTDAKLQKIISHLEQKNNELQKENNEMKTLIKNSGDKNEQKLVNTIDNLTQENYQLKNEIQEIKTSSIQQFNILQRSIELILGNQQTGHESNLPNSIGDKPSKEEPKHESNPPNKIDDKPGGEESKQKSNPPNNIGDKPGGEEPVHDDKKNTEKSLEHFNNQPLQTQLELVQQQNTEFSSAFEDLLKYLIDNFGNENYIIIESKLPTKQINEINSDDIIFIKSAFAEKMLKTKIYSKTECIQQFADSITKLANNITTRTIKNCAFCQCSSLTHIKIPKFCSLIEDSAFSMCKELTEVDFSECSVDIRIGKSGFSKCPKLKNVQFPPTLKSIGDSAFSHCMSLTEIEIPRTVEKIGHSAFAYCNELVKAIVPCSLKNKIQNVFDKKIKEIVYKE